MGSRLDRRTALRRDLATRRPSPPKQDIRDAEVERIVKAEALAFGKVQPAKSV